jgi:acetyl-CoA C-acetyltransferase
MTEAYIYDAIRTPRGKGKEGGGLHELQPIQLLSQLFAAVISRQQLPNDALDDVVLGCVTQVGEQGGNIAKVAALYAGLDSRVSGVTINRYCSSGLDACNFAAMKINAGVDDLVIAGGVECMSRVAMLSDKASFYSDPATVQAARFVPMGLAADLIASLDGISREQCDAYAVQSQQRAATAREEGRFDRSLITIKNDDGQIALDRDEIIRADVTTELLAGFETSFSSFGVSYEALFKRVFPELGALEHVHHKGNSPGIVDGASMVLIGNREAGKKFELKARARVRSIKNASASEWLGLTGGIEAAKAVVFSGKMQAADIDLYEFNEAFASTSVKFRRELGVGPEIVNVNGGAISLGHAMGATGATLLGTVLDELERSDLTTGLVAVSGAAGVGTAMIIERV